MATNFSNGDAYLILDDDDEIIKITILSDVLVDVTDRAQFGTASHSQNATTARIVHSGEVDGSCYSFPQTCSAPDSF